MKLNFKANLKVAALSMIVSVSVFAHAQELVGATETIKRYLAAKGRPAQGELTPFELIEVLNRMDPKASGEKWASTYFRNHTARLKSSSGDSFSDRDELSALPGPETWPSIDAWFTENHVPLPYQILSSYLVGNRDRLRKLLFELAKTKSTKVNDVILKLGVAWGDREMVTAAVHREIDQINQKIEATKRDTYRWDPQMRLPELSPTFGQDFSTEIIKYALDKTNAIVLVNGKEIMKSP